MGLARTWPELSGRLSTVSCQTDKSTRATWWQGPWTRRRLRLPSKIPMSPLAWAGFIHVGGSYWNWLCYEKDIYYTCSTMFKWSNFAPIFLNVAIHGCGFETWSAEARWSIWRFLIGSTCEKAGCQIKIADDNSWQSLCYSSRWEENSRITRWYVK